MAKRENWEKFVTGNRMGGISVDYIPKNPDAKAYVVKRWSERRIWRRTFYSSWNEAMKQAHKLAEGKG
jgi:hypothetical protein